MGIGICRIFFFLSEHVTFLVDRCVDKASSIVRILQMAHYGILKGLVVTPVKEGMLGQADSIWIQQVRFYL